MQKRTNANKCPLCRRGHVIRQSDGWFSSVMRCSRYPKCKFTKKDN